MVVFIDLSIERSFNTCMSHFYRSMRLHAGIASSCSEILKDQSMIGSYNRFVIVTQNSVYCLVGLVFNMGKMMVVTLNSLIVSVCIHDTQKL